jgi:hypothetical protein
MIDAEGGPVVTTTDELIAYRREKAQRELTSLARNEAKLLI